MITATLIDSTNATAVYTSDGETGITTLMICNHGVQDAIINVHVVPSGGSVSNTNQILKNLTIVTADTFVMDMEKLILSDNDKIYITSDVANVVNSVISSMAVA
jgi:hypothetical protein